jgi:hypothetical protein
MIQKPVSVYINWSAYDELSDNVELTEALALRQLEQLMRWRSLGARLDYYLVDAFRYSRESGFREFRKPHWPDGPDRWQMESSLVFGFPPIIRGRMLNWISIRHGLILGIQLDAAFACSVADTLLICWKRWMIGMGAVCAPLSSILPISTP